MKVIKYIYLFTLLLIIVSSCEMKNNPVEIKVARADILPALRVSQYPKSITKCLRPETK